MTNSQLDQEIRGRIDRFLDELTRLVKKSALESVQTALGQEGPRRAPATAAATARGGARKGRARGRRGRAGEMEPQAVLAHIQSHPGLRLEELGKSIGTPTRHLKGPIGRLSREGALRTEGQRRGTRYFATGRSGGATGNGGAPARRGGRKGKRKAKKSTKKKAA